MGIMVYSLLWVMQDFDHQPYLGHADKGQTKSSPLHCLARRRDAYQQKFVVHTLETLNPKP